MEAVKLIALGVGLLSGFLLIVGLASPVVVLWWMDYQNRLRVIRLYGTICLIALVVYLLM